jgi:molybdopterin-guanine dinucleotide biosynthesis protein A
MIDTVTAVILAGGKSSRMGTDKALLEFHGKPLVQIILDRLQPLFTRIMLSVNSPETLEQFSIDRVVDRYPETGPMGGITSVLESGEERIFCIACDMPFLNRMLIEYLCSLQDCDAVVPVWKSRLEVMHSIYTKAVLAPFQRLLERQQFRIAGAFPEVKVRYVQDEEIRRIDPEGASFRNLNTPEDYRKLLNGPA